MKFSIRAIFLVLALVISVSGIFFNLSCLEILSYSNLASSDEDYVLFSVDFRLFIIFSAQETD